MSEFVASNGVRVSMQGLDHVAWFGGQKTGWHDVDITRALREFFLAERDAELGRWRSKEDPEYVVYAESGYALVFDERTAILERISRDEENDLKPVRVAREFFAAHPERKPWHDAQDGEVWELGVGGGYHASSVSVTGGKFVHGTGDAVRVWELTDDHIDYGRRIWPEGN